MLTLTGSNQLSLEQEKCHAQLSKKRDNTVGNPKLYPRCSKIIQKCDHLLGICYKKILPHRDLVTTDILKDVGHVFFYLISSIAQPLGDPLIFIRLLVKNLGTFFHRFRCLLGRQFDSRLAITYF
jgi:hypothetical protein